MAQSLPPIASLRAFEAAARHMNFTRAAEELAITQAAVSYQIRLLEERLGISLFIREPRRLLLTESGAELAIPLRDAFDRMRATFESFHKETQSILSLSVSAAARRLRWQRHSRSCTSNERGTRNCPAGSNDRLAVA